MNGRNFESETNFDPESQRIASLRALLQKISDAMPLLDQAGYDIAAVHLQTAYDELSANLIRPLLRDRGGVLVDI